MSEPVRQRLRVRKLYCPQCESKLDVSDIEPFTKVDCPSCGKAVAIPLQLGGFALQAHVAANGWSDVFEADSPTYESRLHLRLLHAQKADLDLAAFTAGLEKWETEAPGIVDLELCEVGEDVALLHPQLPQSIGAYLDTGKTLRASYALIIMQQVVESLQALAAQNCHPLSLSVDQIYVTDDGDVQLAELGLRETLFTLGGGRSTAIDTYFSPVSVTDAFRETPVFSERETIFSLGCLYWMLATGRAPWLGSSAASIQEARKSNPVPEPEIALRESPPPELAVFLRRLISPDRPQTLAEVQTDLNKLLGEGGGAAAPPRPRKKISSKRRGKRRASYRGGGGSRTTSIVLLVAGLLAAGLLGVFFSQRAAREQAAQRPPIEPATRPAAVDTALAASLLYGTPEDEPEDVADPQAVAAADAPQAVKQPVVGLTAEDGTPIPPPPVNPDANAMMAAFGSDAQALMALMDQRFGDKGQPADDPNAVETIPEGPPKKIVRAAREKARPKGADFSDAQPALDAYLKLFEDAPQLLAVEKERLAILKGYRPAALAALNGGNPYRGSMFREDRPWPYLSTIVDQKADAVLIRNLRHERLGIKQHLEDWIPLADLAPAALAQFRLAKALPQNPYFQYKPEAKTIYATIARLNYETALLYDWYGMREEAFAIGYRCVQLDPDYLPKLKAALRY